MLASTLPAPAPGFGPRPVYPPYGSRPIQQPSYPGYGPGYGEGCSASCGPEMGTGCGPDPAINTISFVGGGMGDYDREVTYRYVGYGAGSYGVIPIPVGNNSRIFCCICVPLVVIVAIPLLFYMFSSSSAPGGQINGGAIFLEILIPVVLLLVTIPLCFMRPTGGQVNICCCVGIPLVIVLVVPLLFFLLSSSAGNGTSSTFDCSTKEVWGLAKSLYCCTHEGRGCPGHATPYNQ